ncbi:MAG: hypothetical protein HQL16_03830 [Candidatus Omnitrophica bacterium]|nr:hypothetical protein [Candidatus Omnitrophota bacterium]
MNLEKSLTQSIHRSSQKGRSAVLFTGGLDSTVLALLAAPRKPLLVFAAIDAPECQRYNDTSITLCQKIAALLGLRFFSVKIRKSDYLRHFQNTIKIIRQPIADKDLPAVNYLLKTLKKIGISSVLSGIGSDEIFSLPKAQLRSFLEHKAKSTLKNHKKIAGQYGISFHCPYLSPAIIRYGLSTPSGQKNHKQALQTILKEQPPIYKILKDRNAAHSIIPVNFWAALTQAY